VLVVLLWVALFFTYSQSSFVALAIGVVVAAILAWRWRAVAVVVGIAVVAVAIGLAAPQLSKVRHSLSGGSSAALNRATRGRSNLLSNGTTIVRHHPAAGVGVGGFTHAYLTTVKHPGRMKQPKPHNTPLAVAAETGLVGLALYVWVLAALARASFAWPGARGMPRLVRTAAAVVLTAIFAHSLLYNAFFEDPLVWGFFALIALARSAERAEAPVEPGVRAEYVR
jgi:O-antigen ligase